MNMLLFVWTIIFISCSGDSGDSGEGYYDYYDYYFGVPDAEFKSNVIDFFPESDEICPCTPRGVLCDILPTCQQDARFRDIDCFGDEVEGLDFLFCGNDPEENPIDALFTPVFLQTPPFIPGDIGICVSSPFGINGIIRAIIENIEDLIDEFLGCEPPEVRRLQDGTTSASKSPFHGDPKAFQKFVELLEWEGSNNAQELIPMIFQEGGIGHLVAIMKQKQSPSGTRRLLDDSGEGEGDEFGLCDFLFMQGFFAGGSNRRRLSIDGPFNPETDAFEFLLSELFTNADCEKNKGSTPILCMIKDTMNHRKRRRLDSGGDSGDSGESGDGGDDDRFDFSCCGGFSVGTSIQLTTSRQSDTCADQIAIAGECLNNFANEGEGCRMIGPSGPPGGAS